MVIGGYGKAGAETLGYGTRGPGTPGTPGESASVNGLAGCGAGEGGGRGRAKRGCRKDTTILLLGRVGRGREKRRWGWGLGLGYGGRSVERVGGAAGGRGRGRARRERKVWKLCGEGRRWIDARSRFGDGKGVEVEEKEVHERRSRRYRSS